MKYTVEIELDLPREKVIEIFDNPDNMQHWQTGFLSFEPISGTPGERGAKSRLRYMMGKKEMELIETITLRDLPERFDGTYECPGVWNEVKNRFEVVGSRKTRWVSENEFRFSSFFMKLMAFVMPGVFRRQSRKFMQNFKEFAEQNRSVLPS